MRSSQSFRFLFILYCIEAGVVLLMAPWSANWEGIVLAQPIQPIQELLLLGIVRGAISGFGLVHLVWAVHDMFAWLASRNQPEEAEVEGVEGTSEGLTEAATLSESPREPE